MPKIGLLNGFLTFWRLRNIKTAISYIIMMAACMQQALPGLAVGKHTSTNLKARTGRLAGFFNDFPGILRESGLPRKQLENAFG
jgi:hypothetical protein